MLLCNSLQLVCVLSGTTDINLVLVDLDLEPRRKEGVESNNQVWVALEEVGYSADHAWGVNTGRRQ